jgi:DNA-binding NarL/FixJ family response regulator
MLPPTTSAASSNFARAAVHTIGAGDSLRSPSVTRRVIDRIAQQPTPELADQRQLRELTPRERDVLELIARGL